jgi:hypothetical protein
MGIAFRELLQEEEPNADPAKVTPPVLFDPPESGASDDVDP